MFIRSCNTFCLDSVLHDICDIQHYPLSTTDGREREAKDKEWEAKKAAKVAELALRKKEKRRREKEGESDDEVCFQQ